MEDQSNAAFFMPAPEDAGPTAAPPPPPVVAEDNDGFEFAGGPGDDGVVNNDAAFFAAPPAAAPAPENNDAVFFAPPPPTDAGVLVPDADGAFAGAEPAVATEGEVFFAGPPPPVDESDAPIVLVPAAEEDNEPSPMAKWNAEWQVTLKERKDEESKAKSEMAERARRDMEEFQAQREVKRETKMARNRAEEQSKLEAMEADLENDNSWQRVIKLVEFQQDTEDKADDVTRMRDVMIQLKNDQDKAAILS